jgi:ribosomal protein S18 acetylase RimI-like enzyme
MQPIQSILNKNQLAAAIKNNLYAFFQCTQAVTDSPIQQPGLVVWQTRLPHPLFNGVLSLQAPGEDALQKIEQTLAWFASRQVDIITWWLAPEPSTSPWQELLVQSGFGFDNHTPGMAVELSRLVEPPLPVGLEVRQVTDLDTLRTWAETFIRGYGLPEDWQANLFELMAALGLEPPLQNYQGFLDGQPVAAVTSFLGAGVAGIYNVGTVESARGRGIGSYMTAYPLQVARQMGYRWGILQSSSQGYGVYQRLGFEKLCDMDNYYYKF